MNALIISVLTIISNAILPTSILAGQILSPLPAASDAALNKQEIVLAEQRMDLTTRLSNSYGSQVFADNILLALHYLKNDVNLPIDWEAVRRLFEVEFTLYPGEVFAFHANVLPEFKDPKATMNSRFFMDEGYKALAGLGGNGVCHLASLINWVATDAGLRVVAKANHDFWSVPGVPRENGTSIRSQSSYQNLYIQNSLMEPVTFKFTADSQAVDLKILK